MWGSLVGRVGAVWGGAPIIAITPFHDVLHYRLLLTRLKNMTRGLLVLTWLSLAVEINSKAVHNPGKEGVYGFSSRCKERPPEPLVPAGNWGRYRQLCAWLAVKGGGSRAPQTGRGSSSSAGPPPAPTLRQRCRQDPDPALGLLPARPPESPGMAWHSTESRRDRERASQHRVRQDLQLSGVSEHCHGLASSAISGCS